MNYTVIDDARIDRRIERDLETLKRLLLDEIPGVAALVLVGGFGRGEGSVVYIDNDPMPVNDYDLVVIADKALTAKERKRISAIGANRVGIPHVDLVIIPKKQLRHLPLTMFNYDLKHGGHVFYGPSDFLDLITDAPAQEMPLEEGRILLFNRLICMLECFSTGFLDRPPKPAEHFFLLNQAGKGILACCDARLLLEGAYHHSYRERSKRFQQLCADTGDAVRLVRQATDFKLAPGGVDDIDGVLYWLRVRRVYESTFRDFMARLWQKEFHHWCEVADHYGTRISPLKKFFRSMMPASRCRNHHLEEAQIMTLFGFEETGVDEAMLEKARQYLRCDFDENGLRLWERIRREIVHRYYQANY